MPTSLAITSTNSPLAGISRSQWPEAEPGLAGRPSATPPRPKAITSISPFVTTTFSSRCLAEHLTCSLATKPEEVGIEYGRLLAQRLGHGVDQHRSIQSILQTVADALTSQGFAAHAERRNNELRIVSEHCPFGDAVMANPVICAVDRGMMKGMVAELHGGDATIALESSKPMGDDVCITSLEA
jgi:hypothetical protein